MPDPITCDDPELEDIEISLICEAVMRRYGYDFRDYARHSLRRRMQGAVTAMGLPGYSALQARLLRSPECFRAVLSTLMVGTTEMFRDPEFFAVLRQQVLPTLASYPRIEMWVAGCSTGEEVYALAVLLREAGLADRSRIWATDIDPRALAVAREGVYPADRFRDYARNYQASGGSHPLTHYATAAYGLVAMDTALRRNVVFSEHNLATDASFAEVHLILCRNVLIYFNHELQGRAVRLLRDSLVRRGYLGLGCKETLRRVDCREDFQEIVDGSRIYRLR